MTYTGRTNRSWSQLFVSRNGVVLGLALLLATVASSCSRKAESSTARGGTENTAPKAVKTAKAEIKPLERTIVVTGSFFAREQATLSVKVPGRLEAMNVDIGSRVKQGDILAQIDRTDYELRLKQAEAALGQARARVGLDPKGDDDKIEIENTGLIQQTKALLEEATKNRERIKKLAAEKISSQSELESVEAAYTVAVTRHQDAMEEMRERLALVAQRRAELNLAKKQLVDSSIRSPFAGTVHQRRASIGEFLQVGTPLLVIAEVDPLRLRLEVPERESSAIRPGQPMKISVGGDTNVYAAEIARVSPLLTASNRMLVVEADVPASPGLRPGLFVQSEITISTNNRAICVPESAISSFVGIQKVFVVKDGKAQEKNVTTGRTVDHCVEIISGVNAGDVVVLNPAGLRSNQPVTQELSDAKAR